MGARGRGLGSRPTDESRQNMARSRDERRHLNGARAVALRFKINAYSPTTMPMARLARYLDNLATVLGETNSVHLVSIEEGSTVPVLKIDWEAYPKLRHRANEVRNREGSAHVLKARRAIEDDLAADNAESAELVDEEGARILRFAGATRVEEPEYGPFSPTRNLGRRAHRRGRRKRSRPGSPGDPRAHTQLSRATGSGEAHRHASLYDTVAGHGRWTLVPRSRGRLEDEVLPHP